jgi:hypothetical protein
MLMHRAGRHANTRICSVVAPLLPACRYFGDTSGESSVCILQIDPRRKMFPPSGQSDRARSAALALLESARQIQNDTSLTHSEVSALMNRQSTMMDQFQTTTETSDLAASLVEEQRKEIALNEGTLARLEKRIAAIEVTAEELRAERDILHGITTERSNKIERLLELVRENDKK